MADPEPRYTVEIAEIETAIRAGEALAVAVAVENEGDAGEEEVSLYIDGDSVDSETPELDAGETETVEFEWTAPPESVGTVELAVETPADTATESVTVEDAPASFGVEVEASEFASVGGTVTVTATVTNEGTLEGSQSVAFRVEEETVEEQTVELAGQESERLEFTYKVSDDAPQLSVAVVTDDATAEATVEIVTGSVTPMRQIGSKGGMGVFGWLMFIGMIIILIPLLPFIALLKLIEMLTGRNASIR